MRKDEITFAATAGACQEAFGEHHREFGDVGIDVAYEHLDVVITYRHL